ncbi:MAG TPA: glycosyltransferase family 1 protein [Rhizomicrobium sp.]|jgi:glycosyltransferase involved in cell wall biosynthesis|nr:glycosyltransferase family 1 protein [Rhizomicrobium sp.]
MRIGILWDVRTQWLGGWNYLLNMIRVCSVFAPDMQFVVLSSTDLAGAKRLEVESAGGEIIVSLPPFRRFSHPLVLFGASHKGLNVQLASARIDLIFELTNYLGSGLAVPALSWIPDVQHRGIARFFSLRERLQRDLEFWRRLTFRNHVMLSSEAVRRDIRKFMPKPRAQLHVVPFAVQPTVEVTRDMIDQVMARYGLLPGYVYMPNQFWLHKNHALVFEAVAELRTRRRDIKLVMSGQNLDSRDNSYAQRLERLITDLGIAESVVMLGVIPYADLLALIAGARALFNPSLFEGWSTTVEEAKALGGAMVLSDLAVHREQAGENAFYFDPGNLNAAADALEWASSLPVGADTNSREKATKANIASQRVYAEKLRVACIAALNA